MRILLVEDHQAIREMIADHLRERGFAVDAFERGEHALAGARVAPVDAVVLDLGLPDMDGMQLLGELRMLQPQVPAVIVTARDGMEERLFGLNSGADDYIVKPFSMREVTLRIKAVMRRNDRETQHPVSNVLTIGDIVIDKQRHTVQSAAAEIELTSTEFKLLLYLAEKKGCVHSREKLLQNVWSYNNAGDTRTVDTHVTRLRGKLGAPGDIIKTVRGFGYKIEE